MHSLMQYMDLDSFWSIWFWFAHAVVWSLISHFPMSVPFDMIIQANRADDETAPVSIHCEAMIRAGVFRIVSLFEKHGYLIVGAWCFVLSVLGTLAIWFRVELALATMTFFGPITIIYSFVIWSAYRMHNGDLTGPALRNAVKRQRLFAQGVGLLAIIMSGAIAVTLMLGNLQII